MEEELDSEQNKGCYFQVAKRLGTNEKCKHGVLVGWNWLVQRFYCCECWETISPEGILAPVKFINSKLLCSGCKEHL